MTPHTVNSREKLRVKEEFWLSMERLFMFTKSTFNIEFFTMVNLARNISLS